MGADTLLERIARHLGVTSDASVTVGKLYMTYRLSRPRGRAWQMERNLLRAFVVRFWRRPADDLKPGDWNDHRGKRRKQRTRLGRPPTELTVNLELAAVKRMFKASKLAPFADCKFVKTRTRRESWFSEDQITDLANGSDALRWRQQQMMFRAIVAVMATGGLRISEALSLRWDRLTLRGTTSILGKGQKTRVVAFPPETLETLTALDRHQSCPYVFTNFRRWKPYDQSTIRAWFKTAVRDAGLESVKARHDISLCPHIIRHSAASMAEDRGAPLTWIQHFLGHSSPQTTMVYLHRNETDAALRMARLMSNRKPPRRAADSVKSPLKRGQNERIAGTGN